MQLDGIHHITAITGDAPRNLDFYAGVLGLRLVKKTVNQDDPTVYHLFYADEPAAPARTLTFFEYPAPPAGRRGREWCTGSCCGVGSAGGARFLGGAAGRRRASSAAHETATLRVRDPEGLGLELVPPTGATSR